MPSAVRAPLRQDPVLILLAAAGLLVLGGFLLDVGPPRRQILAGWTIAPILDLLQFWLSRRVYRLPGLPLHARRFWQAVAAGGLIFCAGDVTQLVSVVLGPETDEIVFHPAQSVAVMLGVAVVFVVALIQRPDRRWPSRDWNRLLLDTGIVSSSAGVVAWCLMTRPGLAQVGPADYLVAVFGCAVVLCGVFVSVRCGLSGEAPLTPASAVALVASTVLIAVASVMLPESASTGVQMAVLVIPFFVVLAGPRIQELHGVEGLDGLQWWGWASRRRYALLPYAGTVICAVALVIVLAVQGLGVSAWGALAGLLVNVALVVARQVVALTENNRLLGEIRNREQRLTSLLEHSSEIISIASANGDFQYVSPAVERILGHPVASVMGRCALDILHRQDRARLQDELDRLYGTPGAELTYQGRYRHADGSWRWLEVVSVNLTDKRGIGGVVCNSRDVTESRELHERLSYQAGHDELTGLANRREFTAAMAARAGDVTVLLIDLNGFKQINDTYGHAAGDGILRHVAGLLRSCAGPGDVPARLGGDEFAVLAGGDAAAGERLAGRLRAALRAPAEAGGRPLRVGASIGVATGPAAEPDQLLNAADLRMYEEKQQTRAYTS
ncbi:diguanylate cyclase domain-containing protein [Actinoplanes utahensis]|uniref:Diguanylate cyclase n=1 Tax=Actinoplanes utahensis TaxID=1869 RepID=A0A0A6UF95_ACTUT|nr:diguanylate cyclase [Actinoplanes utahensis]KHD74705.1 hypothetical protein MB27_27320 [Actinoplanes utahensis]GIF34413.1 hypothetical protein Aut01nite_73990 [Actinoplanes utahensis]